MINNWYLLEDNKINNNHNLLNKINMIKYIMYQKPIIKQKLYKNKINK